MEELEVQVGISNSHVHLTSADMKALGIEELKCVKELIQAPNYVSDIVVECGDLKLKVIGPCRYYSQVELTAAHAYKLGVEAPVRMSGRLWDAPLIEIKYKDKSIKIPAILMKRHIHMNVADCEALKVKAKDNVMGYVNKGYRQGILGNIEILEEPYNQTEMHIDREEADAYGLSNGDMVKVRRDEQGMFIKLDGYQDMDEYIII